MAPDRSRFAVTLESLVASAHIRVDDQVESQPEPQPGPTPWDDEQQRMRHFCAG